MADPRMAHDLECNSRHRHGLACNCAVGVLSRLRAWDTTWPQHDTRLLVDDAAAFMRRLIELHNETHNPDCR